MDVFSGVLLLLLGSVATILVFSIIFYVERPKEEKNKDIESDNPVLNFWRYLNR